MDEVTSQSPIRWIRRSKLLQLFPPILFSFFWLLFRNQATNSWTLAVNLLMAIRGDTAKGPADFDSATIVLFAMGTLGLVCLILYFSRNLTLFLNTFFAGFKVCLLLSIFVAGMVAAAKPENGRAEFYPQGVNPGAIADAAKMDVDAAQTSKSALSGFISVIFAYQGWQNANHVRILGVPHHSLRFD